LGETYSGIHALADFIRDVTKYQQEDWETLTSLNKDNEQMSFVFPQSYPKNAEVSYPEFQIQELLDQDQTEAVGAPPARKSSSSPLVASSVKRSNRRKGKNVGFKQSGCDTKGCLCLLCYPPPKSLYNTDLGYC
jgi:hypothetical protein